jgi:DNA-binding CsgD family transcriptional regulator
MTVHQALPTSTPTAFQHDLPDLIKVIGQQDFAAKLVSFLNRTCGAEHAAIFYVTSENVKGVATASIDNTGQNAIDMSMYFNRNLWRHDPTFVEVKDKLGESSCVTARTNIPDLPDSVLRDIIYGRRGIRDRVLVGARNDEAIVGLSLCSSRVGFFAPDKRQQLEAISETLFSLLSKHIDITKKSTNVSLALTSLEEIETCICQQMQTMPRREAEVCSRVIYGVSSLGISLELGISVETVMTYRKRAYARLGIATQRELILWYLNIWSEWRDQGGQSRQVH